MSSFKNYLSDIRKRTQTYGPPVPSGGSKSAAPTLGINASRIPTGPGTGRTPAPSTKASLGEQIYQNKFAGPADPWGNARRTVIRPDATGATAGGGGGAVRPDGSIGSVAGSSGGGSAGAKGASPAATAAIAPQVTGQGGSAGALGSGQAKTEFGKLFKPEAFAEAWADPEALVETYLNYRKQPGNTGGAAMTHELDDNLGIMYMLSHNNVDPSTIDDANYIDWAGQWLDNMRTAGGKYFTTRDVMSQILGDNKHSPVFNNLYADDMTAGQQVDAVMKTMRYGLESGMPSMMLDALLSQVNDMGKDYRAAQLTGTNKLNFGDYLQSKGFMKGI